MNFRDELIYNKEINDKNGLPNYVDLDYAIERLEEEKRTDVLKNIPMDNKDFIDMNHLINALSNDEKSQYQIMGE